MATDNLYIMNAVTRMAQGLISLVDSDGDDIVENVQLFLFPYPGGSNWICVHSPRLITQEKSGGKHKQVWSINLRIGVGNLGQELGGIQQTKLFERIPIIANWITEHPHLQFAGATNLLTYLDTTIGISVQPGTTQSRVENTETGHFIWAELTVNIPFSLDMSITKYQDGQLITVT